MSSDNMTVFEKAPAGLLRGGKAVGDERKNLTSSRFF